MADCRNCEFGGRPSYEWPCNICTDSSAFKQKPKPTTNADRIRAMSDEELAKFMRAGCDNITQEACRRHAECTDCWLEWLKSTAGGDGDG